MKQYEYKVCYTMITENGKERSYQYIKASSSLAAVDAVFADFNKLKNVEVKDFLTIKCGYEHPTEPMEITY